MNKHYTITALCVYVVFSLFTWMTDATVKHVSKTTETQENTVLEEPVPAPQVIGSSSFFEEDTNPKLDGVQSPYESEIEPTSKGMIIWYTAKDGSSDYRFIIQNGKQGRFEMVLNPGDDPSKLKLCLPGLEDISLQADGSLFIPGNSRWTQQSVDLPAYQIINGNKQAITATLAIVEGCLQYEIGNYDNSKKVFINPGLKRKKPSNPLEKTGSNCGPSVGTYTTVTAKHPSVSWILEFSIQGDLNSLGYCAELNNSAAPIGAGFTVVDPDADPDFPHTQAIEDDMAAAMSAISDASVNSDPDFDVQLNRAIWALEGTLSVGSISGVALTIYNNVQNGTYQPVDVVWLKPDNLSYQYTIALPAQCDYDYGDLPDSYGDFGIAIDIGSPSWLGGFPDAENGMQTSTMADGDDNDSDGDDEDGVTFVGGATLMPGQTKTIEVDWSTYDVDAFIYGWIDFNQDGDFDSPDESIYPLGFEVTGDGVSGTLDSGTETFQVTVPQDAECGTTYARFYIHSDDKISPTGIYDNDGEVEDYKLTITDCPTPVDPPSDVTYECGDDVQVEQIGVGAKCDETTTINLPNSGSVFQYVVEIVYKGDNPGSTIIVEEADGDLYSLARINPPGTSSNVWVYRGVISGSTTAITYTDTDTECKLQSIVVNTFRTLIDAPGSVVEFTSLSGYRSTESFTIDIPTGSDPRDLRIKLPISELTDDCRLLYVTADAGGVSETITLEGPDTGLGDCCLAIPEILLEAVDGATDEVTITLVSPNGSSSSCPVSPDQNGQSYVVAGLVEVEVECTESVDPPTDETYECGDNVQVDEIGVGAKCQETTIVPIPNSANVFQYAVEIVYKGDNPGSTIDIQDDLNNTFTLVRYQPPGTSSSVWVYRGLIDGTTSTVTYEDTDLECKLQSIVVYPFSNVVDAPGSVVKFTAFSGYRDVQTFDVTIPTGPSPRDLTLNLPISELTEDCRLLHITVAAGGVSETVTIDGPDDGLGNCCLNIPSITLQDVPGSTTLVEVTVVSPTGNSSSCPVSPTQNGQSYTVAGLVEVEIECSVCNLNDPEIVSTCDDNGTPSDPSDDTFTYTIKVTGSDTGASYSISGDDTQSGLSYGVVEGPFGPFPIADGDLSIDITDSDDSDCEITNEVVEAPATCSDLCDLNTPIITVNCDDNGTPSDPSDDQYFYYIEVSGVNTGASYNVTGDDSQSGLSYGEVEGPFGPFSITGGDLLINVVDVDDSNCREDNIPVSAPSSCSDECALNTPNIQTFCDDNGTPSDPSDDTFTYFVTVSGSNTGATYSISGDDSQSGLSYDVQNGPFGPFPISGGDLTINITDVDDSGCQANNVLVDAPVACSNQCNLNVPEIVATCDDNGTPSDPSDDTFTYTIKVTGANTGASYSIMGDNTQSGLSYDVVEGPFGPFPISSGNLTIDIVDADDPDCDVQNVVVSVPATCSDECELFDPVIITTCDDNGTPSDPSDDTFSYLITVEGNNTGSSYIISGDDMQSGVNYGAIEGPFGPFPIAGGDLSLIITDSDSGDCQLIGVAVVAPTSCSDECDLTDPVVQTVCSDNGTPTDPSDDTYTYTIFVDGANTGSSYSISGDDTQTGLSYGVTEGPFGPFPIAGGDLNLMVTDSNDPNCQEQGFASAPNTCSDDCSLNTPTILTFCDDNGTSSDPSDDTFTYLIQVTGSNTGATYSISGDDTQSGLSYGSIEGPFGPFPISGGDLSITITDSDDGDCELVDVPVDAPTVCSNLCNLDPPAITATCDDNGTPSDPSDDTFTFTIEVSGSNTGSTYSISGDVTASGLAYDAVQGPFGPFPIVAGDLTINIMDSDNPLCELIDIQVNAPATCSDECALDTPTILTFCDNNGTPSDPSDDTFTYLIQVTGDNTGGTYSISGDDIQSGLTYGVIEGPFGPFPIVNGNLEIDITDSDDADCGLEDVVITAPASCSDQCDLDAPIVVATCGDNGTPSDPTDDVFTFTVLISGDNTGSTYDISGDITAADLDYNVVNGPYGPFPISGGDLTINITDGDDPFCQLLAVPVNAPATCSDECDLDPPTIITNCDDNGTPSDPSDDTYTYLIQVTGSNTGATYNILGDDTQNGLTYGAVEGPFGPFPISGGSLTITILDSDDGDCQVADATVPAPMTCSGDCNLGVPTIATTCDDNGTPTDPSDDTFTYTVSVSGANTGATYSISGDDTQSGLSYDVVNGPYGPFPIADGDLVLTITDVDDSNCETVGIAVAPATCSDECDLNLPIITTVCNDNGTPTDPSDDTYTYTVEITGVNTGSTYDISGDDSQTGLLYGVVNGPFGPFNIADGNLTIDITDDSDASCKISGATVTAPATCSDECLIINPTVVATCDDNGTPSDPTDDTFTYTIQVTGVNGSSTYNITGDDNQVGLTFGEVEGPFGPFPIVDGDLSINIIDSNDPLCQLADVQVNAPATCSDLCDLDPPTIVTFCNDNGTPSDPSDDTFTYIIEVDGANTGATYSISGDDTQSGLAYGLVNGPFGPFAIADGDLTITITDSDDSDCEIIDEIVEAPETCSGVCNLFPPTIATVCDDNGTPSDPSDDTYTYTILVDGNNIGTTYSITGDDTQSDLSYGVINGPYGPFPIADGDLNLTITDADDANCTTIGIVAAPATCSDECLINDPIIVAVCDDNGTPTDPSDDTYTYTIEVTGVNVGATYSIAGDDTQTGLAYGVQNGPFGPFPIASGDLSITIVDGEDADCTKTATVTAPATCSDLCDLDPPVIVATCDDNGTPSDPSDDTFTYTIQVSGVNNASTYDISGDDIQNNLAYDVVNGPFGPFPIVDGDLSITITDDGDPLCDLIDVAVNAPATCSDECELNDPVIIATCDDNGTPSNPNDDTYTYTIQVNGANTGASYSISGDDTQSGLAYNVVNGPFGPFTIAGGDLTITITDSDDADCQVVDATVDAPAACSDQCDLDPPVIVATCDDNGTPSDPSDDTFTYTILVDGDNTGITYSISGDDTQSGLVYGVVNGPFGPFPIAAGDLSITITDAQDPDCQLIDIAVNAPQTCSDLCDLNEPIIIATCDDNGTPSDPSDDTFTYTIEVTGANTGGSYSISGDDTQSGLPYGIQNGPFGPFPIAGGDLDITVTDSDDANCEESGTIVAPEPCSGVCNLNPPVIVAVCDDNGTPSDPSDDTFTYTIEVSGENTGASYSISGDDTQSGLSYDVVNGPFGPFPIAGGDLSITITDSDDANCQLIDIAVNAPASCSDECDLNDPIIVAVCDDNGTPTDPSDDTFTYTVEVTGVNTGASYSISGDDTQSGLAYGVQNGPFGPFPIADGDLNITITDVDDGACSKDATVTAPAACSGDCFLNAPEIDVICNDNGTPSDPSDDIFFYKIRVTGDNTGVTYNITGDDTQSGLNYGAVEGPFGPFSIAAGDITINITDVDDPTCTLIAVPVNAPATCSDECEINDPIIQVQCDDNGTPFDPLDDTFTYTIEVTGSNTGTTYSVSGDDAHSGLAYDNQFGPYGPFLIVDGNLELVITDDDDPDCSIEATVVPPPACSDQCFLDPPVIETVCDDNGTPTDPSDDTYTYTILVTGVNVGTTYDVSGDDTQSGLTYGVVEGPFGPFPVADGDLTIVVTDGDDEFCELPDVPVNAPSDCSDECDLNTPIINVVCDDNGTPTDPSDDTFTYTIEVTGVNTGSTYNITGSDTQSGLSYGVQNGPFGPFPTAGGNLNIVIVDGDDAGCTEDATVIAPAACSDNCSLNPPIIVATCNDNGTPTDPSDDTFTYTIEVTGANTGGTYSITGDDTQSGLSYGVINGPYGPFPIVDGDLTINITDSDDPLCQLIAVPVNAPATCSDECLLNEPQIIATCDDNGTPTDPSDDTFTYVIEVTGVNTGATYNITGDDSQAGLAYGVQNGPFGPFPIANGDLNIVVVDADDGTCTEDATVNAPAACSDVCNLEPPLIQVICNDNGTPTDPTDDLFSYKIRVDGANTGATFSISGDDTQSGLAYGVNHGPFGPFSIADGDLSITITDSDDPLCQLIDIAVNAPASCSDECDINEPQIIVTCDDNNTPTDPTDDFFTYLIEVSGANTGSTYNVTGDDTQAGLLYGIQNGPFGPFPIADGNLDIVIIDGDDASCTEDATIIAPDECSEACDLDPPVIVATCDDNGTPTDPTDDFFTYTIQVTGDNTGGTYSISGDNTQSGLSYGVVNGPFGPFPIADGDLSINITDSDDPLCELISVAVNAPSSCSDECDINTPQIIVTCDDNGTPTDPSDDTFTYVIEVTGANTGSTYNIAGDDSQTGLAYGVQNGPFGPFSITGGDLNIVVVDGDDATCTEDATVTAPAACSENCNLDPPLIQVICNDNGTPTDPTDDVFSYKIRVDGANTGATYSISGDDTQSGLAYGVNHGPFGPFPIVDGDLSITITDSDDPTCNLIDIAVNAPASCSDECDINEPQIIVTCDDNGTPTDPSDDTFTYVIEVTGANTGSTYNITGDDSQSGLAYGVQNGPFGPFNIADGDLDIVVVDGDDATCTEDATVVAPETCSDECDLDPPVIVATCDDNGTPTDPTDDFFTYTIQVTGDNTGGTYSISGDDTQSGLAYGVVNGPFGPFPIADGDLSINITDSDDPLCELISVAVNAPATCSDECDINEPQIIVTCDDNGTPTDPSDDTFTYVIEVTGANTGSTYNITGDDSQSGLAYGVQNGPFGPFNIADGDLDIVVVDGDDATCTEDATVVAPETCSDECDLDPPVIVATCDDNGTPTDPTDDFFTYTIQVTGDNTGGTYSISGDDTQSGLAYGVVNGPFGPFPIADGDLSINITDSDDPLCELISVAVNAPATCSDECDINTPQIIVTCDDNGTPTDPSDDTFTYVIEVTGANTGSTYNITGDDVQNGLAYGVQNGPFGPFNIADGDLDIVVVDGDDASCTEDATVVAPETCSDECDLDPPVIVATCDDNGTPTDPSDDFFTYTIQVTGDNTGGTYSISGDDTQSGLAYGVVNGPFGPFPIADGDLSINITDSDDPLCELISVAVNAPATCSDECDINEPQIIVTCDDNGTPTDPSDDTFTYVIEVTGANTGSTYNITGDDVQNGLAYGVQNGPFGPFNIADGDLDIVVVDGDDASCTEDATVVAPETCSDECDLDPPVIVATCDDNGTPTDPSDDFFTYTIQVTGDNTGGTYSISGDDTQSGLAYGVVNGPFGPFPIADGDLSINITDSDDPLCELISVAVNAPATCSDECDINEPQIIVTCDDNGTPTDPTDDTFTYVIEVTGANTGSTYNITGDDVQNGLAYGVQNGPFGPFNIADGDLDIVVVDGDDASCTEDATVVAPETCSDECDLDPPVIVATCDDNGTPTDPTDDTFTYTILVTGDNTGGTYSISGDDTQSGLAYGVVNGPFGPFPIADGDLSINITDSDDPLCELISVAVNAPATCSDECDINEPQIIVTCDDNGTPTDPTDDTFTYVIEVTGANTGSTYNITGDDVQNGLAYGVQNGPFGPFNIADGDLDIVVVDGDDASCTEDATVVAPETCSDECDLDPPVIVATCDDNGTPTDPSDDFFTYTIQVTGDNTGGTYSISGDDTQSGLAYGVVNGPFGPFPIADGDLSITITDSDDPTCNLIDMQLTHQQAVQMNATSMSHKSL